MNATPRPPAGGGTAALGLLVRRSLRQHALSSAVTMLSVALAGGLVMAVWILQAQSYRAFTGGGEGFDAVVGARGAALPLVLNAVFHLETSPGNIPWSEYQSLAADPRVRLAVPYAVGDNYQGQRIVGTTPERFSGRGGPGSRPLRLRPGGRLFEPAAREAVLGSSAARRTGLRVGDTFHPAHGLEQGGVRHQEAYTVAGILEPSGGPSDRVIWVPIETVWSMKGHVLRGTATPYEARPGEAIPDEHKEVSAVLLQLRGPQAGFSLDEEINREGKSATFAWPVSRIMAEFFDRLGWVRQILALVAYLVAVVAAGSILASIHNSIHERRRDLAILRALGARRRTVFTAVVLEAATIAGLGSLGGFGVCAAILAVAAAIVRAQTGVVIEVLHFHPSLVATPLGLILLGALAGIVPAFKAYASEVAENLGPIS